LLNGNRSKKNITDPSCGRNKQSVICLVNLRKVGPYNNRKIKVFVELKNVFLIPNPRILI